MSLSVGKAIKIIREAKGISLGALANEAKISIPYLSLVENEKRSPSFEVIERISNVLDTPMDVFLKIASGKDSSLTSKDSMTDRMVSFLSQISSLENKLKGLVDGN